MILESLLRDPQRQAKIAEAISNLHEANAFAALLEIGMNRSSPTATEHPMEVAAMRAAWKDGYVEALSDLANFFSRYIRVEERATPIRDFGSLDKLKQQGDISEEEYDRFRSSYPS